MSARGRITVIDLDLERLSFVSGSVGSGRVGVEAWGSVALPSGLDAADAEAMGEWLGQRLREARVPAGAGRVLVCVPRGNVVMKRLSFPGLESHDDPDLVAMVRLQMTRQMPMKVDGTAIDFVPLARMERPELGAPGVNGHASVATGGANGAAAGPDETGLEVLACALPGDRVDWCRKVAHAAGVRLGSLSLRASGAATLLAQGGHGTASAVLGVSIGWSSVELVVVRDGEIVFVRSADVAMGEDVDAGQYAERVAVEAKRTWMAYRVSAGSSEISAAVVVGGGELSREVAERCAEALALPASVGELPGFVTFKPRADAAGGTWSVAEAAALAPLVGLMVAQASDHPVFDFAHPRRAPDTTAGARRMVLLGALGAIVVVGGGLVVADMQVRRTAAAAKQAEREAREWGARVVEHMRADARLRHTEQWLAADVDWVAHWAKISDSMPRPPEALLDSLGGSLTRAQVVFQPGGSGTARTYVTSGWKLSLEAVLHATGRMSNRIVGNQFRERLVADPTYLVESRGADTETRFDMDLVTTRVSPGAARSPVPPAHQTASTARTAGQPAGEGGAP